MKKIIIILAAALMTSCQQSNVNYKIDQATGYGIIDYGSEGTIVLGPNFVIVKRDSTYYVPQTGNTYHTMAVKVYNIPSSKLDSVMQVMPSKTDTTTWNQK